MGSSRRQAKRARGPDGTFKKHPFDDEDNEGNQGDEDHEDDGIDDDDEDNAGEGPTGT